LRARRWNDVADIFDDEQIAGLALGDELGEHARIRAGDEQRVRILSFLRQLAEQLAIIAKLFVAKFMNDFDELVHKFILTAKYANDAKRKIENNPFEYFACFAVNH